MSATAIAGALTAVGASIVRRRRAPLDAPKARLAGDHAWLARVTAWRYRLNWPNYADDFDSASSLALVEAAESFDLGRGIPFVPYARVRIVGALKDVQRAIAREIRLWGDVASRPAIPLRGEDARDLLCLPDPRPSDDATEAATEEVARWLDGLPTGHAEVCRLIYLGGHSQAEVARIIGRAKSWVCRLHAEAIELLRLSPRVREAAADRGLDVA